RKPKDRIAKDGPADRLCIRLARSTIGVSCQPMEEAMSNGTPMPDPAGLLALLGGNVMSLHALAEALCDLGIVEKMSLIVVLERKVDAWRGRVSDDRALLPLRA